MSIARHHLRPLTWLALVAMLALALLPTLSHAWALARGGSDWAEVCTPQGTRLVAVQAGHGGGSGAPLQAHAALDHCPFCALNAGALAPPRAAPAAALVPPVRALLPTRFLQAPRTLFAWRGAQPRGPPALS